MFQELFKDLPDGACWISGKRLKALGKMLDGDRFQLMDGQGSELPTSSGRFALLGGAAEPVDWSPFKCIVRNIGGSCMRGIALNSVFQLDQQRTNTMLITGLLTSLTPGDDDSGWQSTSSSDYGWLYGEVGSGSPPTITSLSIQSIGAGNSYGPEVEDNGPQGSDPVTYSQKAFRVPIYTMGGDDDLPAVTEQIVNSRLALRGYGLGTSFTQGSTVPHTCTVYYPFPTG